MKNIFFYSFVFIPIATFVSSHNLYTNVPVQNDQYSIESWFLDSESKNDIISSNSKKKTGYIYYFNLDIEDKLVDEIKVEDKSRNWLSGYSERQEFPDSLKRAMRSETAELLSSYLEYDVICYKKNRGNSILTPVDTILPMYNLGTVYKDHPNNYYIYIWANITDGGWAIDYGDGKTKAKPQIKLVLKVFNSNKDKILKKEIKIKDFRKLRSETKYEGSVKTVRSETLTPMDIYMMYTLALRNLIREG